MAKSNHYVVLFLSLIIHAYAIPAFTWFLLILKVDTVQDVGVCDMLM